MLDNKWLRIFHFHRISVRLCFELKECHREDVCNDHPNYSVRQCHSRISIFDKIFKQMKLGKSFDYIIFFLINFFSHYNFFIPYVINFSIYTKKIKFTILPSMVFLAPVFSSTNLKRNNIYIYI